METATMPIFPKNVLLSVCKPLPFIIYMACAVRLSHTIAQSNAFASTGGRTPFRRRRSKRLQLRCVCTVSILIALLLWIGLLAVGERCLQYAALEMVNVDGDRGPLLGQALARGESNVLLLWMYAMAGGMAAVAYCFEALPSQRNAMSNLSADGLTTELGSSAYFLHRPPSVAVLARLQLYYTTIDTNGGGGDEPWRRNQHAVPMAYCANGSAANMFPVRRRRRRGDGGGGGLLRCKSLESIPACLFEPLSPSVSSDERVLHP